MSKIRVLLVEANRLLREGITTLFNDQADIKVVASSGGGVDIVPNARKAKAQVGLIDIGLWNPDSVLLIRTLKKDLPKMKLIGMGLLPTQSDIVEFVEAGASGFILKDAQVEDFLGAVRSVARGENVLPLVLTGSLFSHVVYHALVKGRVKGTDGVRMTKREKETIALIAYGMSNKEIAERLNITTRTVKTHVHNILDKLALHNRLQIFACARNE